MLFYLAIILSAASVIALLNIFFVVPNSTMGAPYVFWATILDVVLVIVIDGATAWLVNRFPKKIYNHKNRFFTVSAKEKSFYEKLKIRKWKDKIPELGALGGFKKDRLENPADNVYVEKFLVECCCGEIVHILSLFTGFFILLFFAPVRWTVGLPVAIVNFILNLPSLFILRYNSYKLEILYKNNARKAARAKAAAPILAKEEAIEQIAAARADV